LEEHPALPRSAADAAREAAAAVAAGARAIHVHPRDATGTESLDPAVMADWVGAIRDACPAVPVGVSTGWWIVPDLQLRLAQIAQWREPLPDFASVNLNEEGAPEVARACLQRGVGIEAGLATAADVEPLIAAGLDGSWLRLLVEVDEPAEVTRLDEALDETELSAPRLYHGYDGGTWPVIREALGRERDVRVGLEDTRVLPNGSAPQGNADLVAAAVALVA
jgi:uncharacterized protein (DUF849 family)